MALIAFDGTGNEDKPGEDEDTNVLRFFRAYEKLNETVDPGKDDWSPTIPRSLYQEGIGKMARTFVGDKVAEAFGLGGHGRIRKALDRMEHNLEAGDPNVDVIGFSRGAALAVAFANEVAEKYPTVRIRFLGIWDLVAEFGAPGKAVNLGYKLTMPANVDHCCHAMALDETRVAFDLTRLRGKKDAGTSGPLEVWFRGVHSDVGGGNENPGLNWISLDWMFANARRCGLDIDQAAIVRSRERSALPANIKFHDVAVGPRRECFVTDLLHASVVFDPNDRNHQRNDPRIPLTRIDNDGVRVAPSHG
jgi:uncharacterized protein (DUF2235 family)